MLCSAGSQSPIAVTALRCVRLNLTHMDRDISPPPAKRQKTASGTVVLSQPQVRSDSAVFPSLKFNTMRIFSWNINGISLFLQKPITSFFQAAKREKNGDGNVKSSEHPASLRGFLQRHNWPTMLFLQEVKIATKDIKTQDAVRAAVNAKLKSESLPETTGPYYEAYFTIPTDRYNARGVRGNGQVNGVCTILRSDIHKKYNVHVRPVHWDQEGRISVVEIESGDAKLAVFNIYAVNGTDYPYRDSNTGAVRGTKHDRKRHVQNMLAEECKNLDRNGWDVLLAGDMNVAPDACDAYPKLRAFPSDHVRNRREFHDKLLQGSGGDRPDLAGIDIWREMHGDERRYTYFSRSYRWETNCDRVDIFIAENRAWKKGCIKACGRLDSEAERGPSDHVPIWADFELTSNKCSSDDVDSFTDEAKH